MQACNVNSDFSSYMLFQYITRVNNKITNIFYIILFNKKCAEISNANVN